MNANHDVNQSESPHKFLARLLADRKITIYTLAKESKLTPDVVSRLVNGKRAFTPDTACRIGKALEIPPENNLLLMQAKFNFAAVASDEKYKSITLRKNKRSRLCRRRICTSRFAAKFVSGRLGKLPAPQVELVRSKFPPSSKTGLGCRCK